MSNTRLSVDDYLMGRDKDYQGECTEVIFANAARTTEKLNSLLAALEEANVPVEINPRTFTVLNSGWRPSAINARTPGSAVRSKHMSAEAGDLYDPDGAIDDYLMAHPELLVELGLYQEHPSSTKGWAHVQTVPPRSGNRVFYP